MPNRRYVVTADVMKSIFITSDEDEACNWKFPSCETFIDRDCGDLYTVRAFKNIQIGTFDNKSQAVKIYSHYINAFLPDILTYVMNVRVVDTWEMLEVTDYIL